MGGDRWCRLDSPDVMEIFRKGGQWQRALQSLQEAPENSVELSVISCAPGAPGKHLKIAENCKVQRGHQRL